MCLALHYFLRKRPNELMSYNYLLSLSVHTSLQLAGRGTKESKGSVKVVEEMLESMQITMS